MQRHLAPLATLLFTCACAAPGPRSASQAPISTDRPGFLFAPTLVPSGRFQLEAGLPMLSVARVQGAEQRTWSAPVALRYGWSDTLELRASLPTWTDTRGELEEDRSGFADAEIGAKFALAPIGGPLSALVSLRVPSGAHEFTTDEPGGSLHVLHGRELARGAWLQLMLGLAHVPLEAESDATSAALAALVAFPLAASWSVYGEASALPGVRHAAGQAYLGTGVVWTARPDVQLDLSIDFGLDEDAADAIAALGFSWCVR